MPLAIDLFCGLGGWTEGLLAEGYEVVGFDVERHEYGEHRYPARLVLQDVLTLHGSQFKGAALIVASPPCQAYSYMAMPWTRAKAIAAEYRSGVRDVEKLNALFDACFRLQREAEQAAGRRIPLVVENVRGAEPWVGRSRQNFGSFYLWGDVPVQLPPTFGAAKVSGLDDGKFPPGGLAQGFIEGRKLLGVCFDGSGRSFQSASVEGTKHRGSGAVWFDTGPAALPSSSPRRKHASAMIAKIPLPLSRHIARTFRDPRWAEEVRYMTPLF